MHDHGYFLKAIIAAPDDDLPRLVYADWLDENGEGERAEFIRVQCLTGRTLCRSPGRFGDPPRTPFNHFCNDTDCPHCEAERRACELLQLADVRLGRLSWAETNEARWVPGPCRHWLWHEQMREHDGHDAPGPEWRRGFVHAVDVPGSWWVEDGDAVLAEHPVQEVTLTSLGDIDELVRVDAPEETGWVLRGDPLLRRYTGADVPELIDDPRVEAGEAGPMWFARQVFAAMLRLRWPSVRVWRVPPVPEDWPFLDGPDFAQDGPL